MKTRSPGRALALRCVTIPSMGPGTWWMISSAYLSSVIERRWPKDQVAAVDQQCQEQDGRGEHAAPLGEHPDDPGLEERGDRQERERVPEKDERHQGDHEHMPHREHDQEETRAGRGRGKVDSGASHDGEHDEDGDEEYRGKRVRLDPRGIPDEPLRVLARGEREQAAALSSEVSPDEPRNIHDERGGERRGEPRQDRAIEPDDEKAEHQARPRRP